MELELRGLVYDRAKAFADANSLKVFFPNRSYSSAGLNVYLRVFLLGTDPRVLTVKELGSLYQWILQVSVYSVEGSGEVTTATVLDGLLDFFPPMYVFEGVNQKYVINRPGSVGQPIGTDGGWFFVPVDFRISTIK